MTRISMEHFIDANVTNFYPDSTFEVRAINSATACTARKSFIERIYMKFNYASISAGAVVKKAMLKLYADTLSLGSGYKGLMQLS